MFFREPTLQYEARVEEPDPHFAKQLQQAIGGQEGEMRVALQCYDAFTYKADGCVRPVLRPS